MELFHASETFSSLLPQNFLHALNILSKPFCYAKYKEQDQPSSTSGDYKQLSGARFHEVVLVHSNPPPRRARDLSCPKVTNGMHVYAGL